MVLKNPDLENIGLTIPKVLLPNSTVSMKEWAVVACDQYTAEPEYWEKVAEIVGDKPSTLNLIYPEVYLNEPNKEDRINKINNSMKSYLEKNIWVEKEGFIYVQRKIGDKVRQGLIVALDLEKYDYSIGSETLIRATEGTIVERLPPRIKIRENAPVELPHIMVLIDDSKKTVIEPLAPHAKTLLYDFELMMDGGDIRGYHVNRDAEAQIISALKTLANPDHFQEKYNLSKDRKDVLLYAMGDGNHSLATAKAIWEQTKENKPENHPSRYALVELVNLHSPALVFEPIHRILFGVKCDIISEMKAFFKNELEIAEVTREDMINTVKSSLKQCFGLLFNGNYYIVTILNPTTNLTVGTLQEWLDAIIISKKVEEIDYVHGTESTIQIGMQEGNVGFFLPVLKKEELFPTVILDGALPRKTFSMGEAEEKRFYLEARKIQ